MPVPLYFDVHIDKAIHDQLRLRGCDVLRAQDDNAEEFSDDRLLRRATASALKRTSCVNSNRPSSEEWQRTGEQFRGLLFGNQLGVTVGTYVKDLELIAKATEPAEWINVVQHPPYR